MKLRTYVFRAERKDTDDNRIFSHEIVVKALTYKDAWSNAVEELAIDDVSLELLYVL